MPPAADRQALEALVCVFGTDPQSFGTLVTCSLEDRRGTDFVPLGYGVGPTRALALANALRSFADYLTAHSAPER